MTRRQRKAKPAFWLVGLILVVTVVMELPYVNWRQAAGPIDGPLTVRHDAKGDGRFQAPRSGNRRHRGIDLAAPLDRPVRAFRSGRVARAGTHRGLGRFVELSHGGGLRSLYAHLQTVSVREGARVRQGEVIGTVGKTGNARHAWITPHVHFEVARDDAPLDPTSVGLVVANHLYDGVKIVAGPFEETDGAGGD